MAYNNDNHNDAFSFLRGRVGKKQLLLNCILATVYFIVLAFGFIPGNHLLFYLLLVGEVYHLSQIFGYCYTIWGEKALAAPFDAEIDKPVDIFITVCGEPVEIVRKTALAATRMNYPNYHVYLLNDGYVARKANWQDIENLAAELGVTCITRHIGGGAKAGNINNALKQTKSPFVVVFDADHVPHSDFLKETMGYFIEPILGFVQTPQYYKNQTTNVVTQTAWDQQALFFGSIMRGKNRLNSAFLCGTNMIIRREALNEVGGMCEFNIAEDFLTSLFIHDKGWKSIYHPKVLAEGLAPEDFVSYYKQQFRWTRGSLEVIFNYNPLFMKGLTWAQRFQYLISASYFLNGLIVLFDISLPIIFLYSGIIAVQTHTMALAIIFIPYMFTSLFTIQKSSNYSLSFSAISFSISSFFLQLRAMLAVLTHQKTSFAVTSKRQIQGNFLYLVIPHIAYILAVALGLGIALDRDGLSASLLANSAWAIVNCVTFLPFILAAAPSRLKKREILENQALEFKSAEAID